MVFVSFEDGHSIYETVLFPRAFLEYYPVIEGGGVFLSSGRVQDDLGEIGAHVDRIVRVSRAESALEETGTGVYGGCPPGGTGPARSCRAEVTARRGRQDSLDSAKPATYC